MTRSRALLAVGVALAALLARGPLHLVTYGQPVSNDDAIPLLDVSAYLAGDRAALDTVPGELRWAFEHVGFYYLRGHGIDRSLIDATYAAAVRFHAQPMEKKRCNVFATRCRTSCYWI